MTTETKDIATPATTKPPADQSHLRTAAKRAYDNQSPRGIADDQIEQYLPMVHKIVQRVVGYLKPPLSYEDLVSAGVVGLVKAARDYDPVRETQFTTYAYLRIKGAILDELRGWSFVPAAVNRQIRTALQTSQEIAEATGETPTDEELARTLGIDLDELYETYKGARARQFLSIDDADSDDSPLGAFLAAANTDSPQAGLEKTELIETLARAIACLSERQRQVIILYYQQQLTMKQIAEVFNITESRVSQLHASALFNLSVKLRHWNDG
ncbi:MAG TPA: FliA/WhiG family RNA polymerase sigma factor [Phycisphaerales bacterium]|nr:FliA/WhiG family RNA polymerase sigma factor [Phycisphaerales bacterium]